MNRLPHLCRTTAGRSDINLPTGKERSAPISRAQDNVNETTQSNTPEDANRGSHRH